MGDVLDAEQLAAAQDVPDVKVIVAEIARMLVMDARSHVTDVARVRPRALVDARDVKDAPVIVVGHVPRHAQDARVINRIRDAVETAWQVVTVVGIIAAEVATTHVLRFAMVTAQELVARVVLQRTRIPAPQLGLSMHLFRGPLMVQVNHIEGLQMEPW